MTSWGTVGVPFVHLELLGGLGHAFWGSGDALGRLQRAVVAKDPLALSAAPRFYRFWRPKGVPKAPKMELKSLKNRFKNLSKFWSDF